MSDQSSIGVLMETVMANLQKMVDVNTIVGQSVQTSDGAVILPISKVSFGFAAGGTEYCTKETKKDECGKMPFGGGSGAGVCLQPVAFMVVSKDQIRLMSVNQNSLYDRIIDAFPQMVDKVSSMIGGNGNKGNQPNSQQPPTVTPVQ